MSKRKGRYVVYRAKDGWRWQFIGGSRIVSSGEAYENVADALCMYSYCDAMKVDLRIRNRDIDGVKRAKKEKVSPEPPKSGSTYGGAQSA